MRYAQIRKMDISNGEELGVSLFVQGCHFHCKGCFNPETWDFTGGKEWNENTKQYFISICDNAFIKRISILGGEPLASENIDEVYNLICELKQSFPQKKIWLYTGYEINELNTRQLDTIKLCDYLVDGKYVEDLKDFNLLYRGSRNQNIIKVGDLL